MFRVRWTIEQQEQQQLFLARFGAGSGGRVNLKVPLWEILLIALLPIDGSIGTTVHATTRALRFLATQLWIE